MIKYTEKFPQLSRPLGQLSRYKIFPETTRQRNRFVVPQPNNPTWRKNQLASSMSLLGLVPDYGSDSSSSSESDDEETRVEGCSTNSGGNKNTGNEPMEPLMPLPLPTLDLKTDSVSNTKELNQRTYQTSSVFFNPFLAEEQKKLSVLEKHVQLSEGKSEEDKHKSKKICFKFQKGRCRLGDRCKFSHDLVVTGTPSSKPEKPREPSLVPSVSNSGTRYEPDEEEEAWEQKKKKRKPGVNDSLVPPKRAMAAYEKQRLNDKPWSQS